LAGVRVELSRVERAEAIDAAEKLVAVLNTADNEVDRALSALRTATDSLFQSAADVSTALAGFDQERFGVQFHTRLVTDLRVALVDCVGQFWPSNPFRTTPVCESCANNAAECGCPASV